MLQKLAKGGRLDVVNSARLFPHDVPLVQQPKYFLSMYQERFRAPDAAKKHVGRLEPLSMDTLEQLYVERKPGVLPKHPPEEFQRLLDTTYKQARRALASVPAPPVLLFLGWG